MCDSLCNKCYFSLAAARSLSSPQWFFKFCHSSKEFSSRFRVLPLLEETILFWSNLMKLEGSV